MVTSPAGSAAWRPAGYSSTAVTSTGACRRGMRRPSDEATPGRTGIGAAGPAPLAQGTLRAVRAAHRHGVALGLEVGAPGPAHRRSEGRRVLDVGCGNGYHCWRMRGAGAAEVIGIDPRPCSCCSSPRCSATSATRRRGAAHGHRRRCRRSCGPSTRCFPWACSTTAARRWRICRPCATACARRPAGAGDPGDRGRRAPVPGAPGRYARMGNVWFLPSSDDAAAVAGASWAGRMRAWSTSRSPRHSRNSARRTG
jgi:hypothetical protein